MKANIEIIDCTLMPEAPTYIQDLAIGECARVTSTSASSYGHIIMFLTSDMFFSFTSGTVWYSLPTANIECTRLKVDIKVHVLGEE